jgi:hypothetical protein
VIFDVIFFVEFCIQTFTTFSNHKEILETNP